MKIKSLEILKVYLHRDCGERNPIHERMASSAERDFVFRVVERCAEFYREDVNLVENKEKRHKLTLDFFEKEVAKLGVNAEVKEFLYCTCLLGVSLQSDLWGYEKFLASLLHNYPLYCLYKIFKYFEDKLLTSPEELDSHKFQNNRFIDIEHIIFVDYALNLLGASLRFWSKLEPIFSRIDKSALVPLECNFYRINTKCREVFGKYYEEMEALFGKNNALWLVVQCLFSGNDSEDKIKPYFSFHTFFAAKYFIAIFRELKPTTLDKLFVLSAFQQANYMTTALMYNPRLDELARQYLDAIFENFRG